MAASSRFAETLFAATASLLPTPSLARLAVAVSGGPDSLALCLLAQTYAREHGAFLVALTVDHGLRAESAQETQQVSAWLGAHGIAHEILRWNPPQARANVQEQAREARYDLLTEAAKRHQCQSLLLAHHADDQAETLLYRLARGSGVDGLAAMAPARWHKDIALLRPLLGWRKEELVALCEAAGQPYLTDPSNDDPRFARTLLRRLLADFSSQGLDVMRLVDTAAHLRRARDALEQMTEALLASMALEQHYDLTAWRKAPEELRLRALRHLALSQAGAPPPRFEALRGLEQALSSESQGSRSLHGLLWRWDEARLTITNAPPYLDRTPKRPT